jgi:hypothetical protein
LLISERLDHVESERELAGAERWQFKQAYSTWDRYKRGELRTVSREEIEEVFTDALADREPTRGGNKPRRITHRLPWSLRPRCVPRVRLSPKRIDTGPIRR